jgi:hypothetical protein
MTDARTTDERYTQAVRASNLSSERVDVDYLIAAGLITETLGVLLYRLAAEWDMASGDYRMALAHVRDLELRSLRAMRASKRTNDEKMAQRLTSEAAADTATARAGAETARVLAMSYLKSLHGTSQAVHRFAQKFALIKRWGLQPDIVASIAAKAMRIWLDSVCSACDGRSFNGGYTSPVLLCTACGATGRALWALDQHDIYAPQIRALLVQMDVKASAAERELRSMIRGR